jgi:hypothetical protein
MAQVTTLLTPAARDFETSANRVIIYAPLPVGYAHH